MDHNALLDWPNPQNLDKPTSSSAPLVASSLSSPSYESQLPTLIDPIDNLPSSTQSSSTDLFSLTSSSPAFDLSKMNGPSTPVTTNSEPSALFNIGNLTFNPAPSSIPRLMELPSNANLNNANLSNTNLSNTNLNNTNLSSTASSPSSNILSSSNSTSSMASNISNISNAGSLASPLQSQGSSSSTQTPTPLVNLSELNDIFYSKDFSSTSNTSTNILSTPTVANPSTTSTLPRQSTLPNLNQNQHSLQQSQQSQSSTQSLPPSMSATPPPHNFSIASNPSINPILDLGVQNIPSAVQQQQQQQQHQQHQQHQQQQQHQHQHQQQQPSIAPPSSHAPTFPIWTPPSSSDTRSSQPQTTSIGPAVPVSVEQRPPPQYSVSTVKLPPPSVDQESLSVMKDMLKTMNEMTHKMLNMEERISKLEMEKDQLTRIVNRLQEAQHQQNIKVQQEAAQRHIQTVVQPGYPYGTIQPQMAPPVYMAPSHPRTGPPVYMIPPQQPILKNQFN